MDRVAVHINIQNIQNVQNIQNSDKDPLVDWVAAVHINIQNIQNTDKDPFVVRVAVHTNSKILEFFLKGEGHDFLLFTGIQYGSQWVHRSARHRARQQRGICNYDPGSFVI